MKTIITAVLIGVASIQAQADGFYQMVVDERTQPVEVGQQFHGEEHSPLYQVVTEPSRTVEVGEIRIWSVAGKNRDEGTPLERQVSGS